MPPPIGRGHFSSLFSHAEPREDPPGDVVPDILPGKLPQGGHGLLHIGEHRVWGEAVG